MTIPAMKEVESSNIHSFGYDPDLRQMHIKFKSGGHYVYDGVPQSEHDAFGAAESKGRHFATNFAGRFQHRKLTDAG